MAASSAAAPAPRAIPAWIDPSLVGTLLLVDDGWPRRWEGGPFHHCLQIADARALARAQAAAARMSVMSGVPRTETGACNVQWVLDEEVGHTYAQMAGTSRAIVSATVHLHVGDLDGDALHEAGHVLGLGHSSNPFHLMAETPRVSDFTPEELAVLAWIYAPSGK